MAPSSALVLGGSHNKWIGGAGSWSTIPIGIGEPPQWLYMSPSTVGSELWAVAPEACSSNRTTSATADCQASRGGVLYNNQSSTRVSDTTDTIPDSEFFYPSVGEYGFDTITINSTVGNNTPISIEHQTVASFSGLSFWMGMLGLGIEPVALDDRDSHPTILRSLKAQSVIPSLSYGYTAGAYYDQTPGNLVLGGYDSAAFTPSGVGFEINSGSSGDRALTLSLQSMEIGNSLQGTVTLPAAPRKDISVAIDTMLQEFWFPTDVCDGIADTLGLTYDNATGFYLVDNTASLSNLNPHFTFTLAANGTSTETVSIEFDWAPFAHIVGPPLYNTTKTYMPLRRAVNDSQSVLGRVFLQEAHLTVDWERGKFHIGQATHQSSNSTDGIVSIFPPGDRQKPSPSRLSGGQIAGIAVGGGVVGILVVAAAWYMIARRRRRTRQRARSLPQVLSPETQTARHSLQKPTHELDGRQMHEAWSEDIKFEQPEKSKLADMTSRAELESPLNELESPLRHHELEA